MMTIIDVQNVSKRFGNLLAVDGCSLQVAKGSITGLIGPNGAGKTTLFNMVAGAFAPSNGRIVLDGEDVTGLPAHKLFSKGLLPDRAGILQHDGAGEFDDGSRQSVR